MGEIADAIIDGEFDYITGEYIGRGVGYPRTFENRKYQICQHKASNGVKHFLLRKGYAIPTHDNIIQMYGEDEQMESKKVKAICTEIQKDFGAFVQWVKNLKS